MLDPSQIPTSYVGIGSYVTITDLDFDDEFEVQLVASIEADPNRDLISNESPMGLALFGHKLADVIEFDTPDGRKRYKVLSIRK